MMVYALENRGDGVEDAPSEVALTRLAGLGDEAAQCALIRRVSGRVKNTCRYLAGENDADDLAQLALMRIVRYAESFRGESTLSYWVDRITVRTVARHVEKANRRRMLNDATWEPGPEAEETGHAAEMSEIRGRLTRHFAAITEKQRSAVVLHYLYEYEIQEIADLLDLRVNAVRSRLRKGLKQLRRTILTDPCLRQWVQEGRG